jgi:ABC-type transporter Mla MlaB component
VKALAKSEGELSLNSLSTLSVGAAEALGEHDRDFLNLNGLTKLDVATAAALARFRGWRLSLDGLPALDASTATALARFGGRILSLDGIVALDESTASAIASLEGKVHINDHDQMVTKGELNLDGLRELDISTAKALAKLRAERLSLGGLASLSDESATALASYKGILSLDVPLSDHAVAALARQELQFTAVLDSRRVQLRDVLSFTEYPGRFDISRLTALNALQAEVLASTRWYLNLSGVASLSDEVAVALASHEGSLSLPSLRVISEQGARALAQHRGPVFITPEHLPASLAQLLMPGRP